MPRVRGRKIEPLGLSCLRLLQGGPRDSRDKEQREIEMSEVVIALDMMGGDQVPGIPIRASELVGPGDGIRLLLFGHSDKIGSCRNSGRKIHGVRHCENSVEMHEKVSRSLLRDKENSMAQVLSAVESGSADCAVSAGNTAAFTAYAISVLGLIKNIERPAIAILLPTVDGKFSIFLDAGANVSTKPPHMLQSAKMGSLYAETVFNINRPRVALLNVGGEATKGDDLRKGVYPLLKESGDINFIGNIEGQELFHGKADVIVTDGFTGNAILKVTEGITRSFKTMLLRELKRGVKGKIGLLLTGGSLKAFSKKIDYAEYGGGMLLGVDGPVVISHGRSSPRALYSAMKLGRRVVESGFMEKLKGI